MPIDRTTASATDTAESIGPDGLAVSGSCPADGGAEAEVALLATGVAGTLAAADGVGGAGALGAGVVVGGGVGDGATAQGSPPPEPQPASVTAKATPSAWLAVALIVKLEVPLNSPVAPGENV